MGSNNEIEKSVHIAMYPWFAMGHLKPFLDLANKLAQTHHIRTSLILPLKAALNLAPDNHHPSLITFVPITVPQVEGLPLGAETSADVLPTDLPFLMAAMDLTQHTVDSILTRLKPDIVLCDFAHWLPELARKHGAKSLYYLTTYLVGPLYMSAQARNLPITHHYTEADLVEPPSCFLSPYIRLSPHEARYLAYACSMPCDSRGMTLLERLSVAFATCDAIAVKSCKEMEGAYCDLAKQIFGKPTFLTGPVCPNPSVSRLDDRVNGWLNGFAEGSVIYCALGTESVLTDEQFQELVLGLQLTGMPFLAALKPRKGCNATEESMTLPEGISRKIEGRGVVYDGWVQQKLILEHPSVGCFVTHCGAGSLTEAIMSESQLVMFPQGVDQYCNARMMSLELKIGLEVKTRAEDGFADRHAIKNAISKVMDPESDVGKEVRSKHSDLRRIITSKRFQECYTSTFVSNLRQLLE